MSIEKPTRSTSELSRKQKIARRFLPVVLIASGVAYGIAEHQSDETNTEYEVSAEASATVSAHAIVEFGKSKTGWGHGTAEKAIQEALTDGLSRVSIATTPGENQPLDIEQVLKTIPVYDQAEMVLELANYAEIAPDPGDELRVGLDVTLYSGNKVSYDITGAEIQDIPNNQQ